VLEVKDLSFAYPDGRQVLRGVSFSIPKGRRLAFVGRNGSGKTTLARLMCGLLKPTEGSVTVGGLSTSDPGSVFEVRRRAGIVFQDPDDQLIEVTVEREIGFGLRNLGLEIGEIEHRVAKALALFGIESLRARACHLLSAGEKQIVTVASVFAMRPDYVILDESTSLLDAGSRRRVLGAVERLLEDTGAGLGFISMRIEDVWMCDEVVFLKDGVMDFCGGRESFLGYLRQQGIPLHGLSLLVSRLDESIPGLGAMLSRRKELSAASVSEALVALASDGEGGSPCL
jgi:energy-coupling factor transporter ATP-binding protein EcfA2